MPGANAAAVKLARAQITRRPVDASQLHISVGATGIHIIGVLRPLRGRGEIDLKDEMNKITDILRQRMHVHNVTWDVTLRL